jgi:hypothetical protein
MLINAECALLLWGLYRLLPPMEKIFSNENCISNLVLVNLKYCKFCNWLPFHTSALKIQVSLWTSLCCRILSGDPGIVACDPSYLEEAGCKYFMEAIHSSEVSRKSNFVSELPTWIRVLALSCWLFCTFDIETPNALKGQAVQLLQRTC